MVEWYLSSYGVVISNGLINVNPNILGIKSYWSHPVDFEPQVFWIAIFAITNSDETAS